MSSSLKRLRRLAEAVPPVARSYRSVRDATRRLPTYETSFGFTITADPGIDTSRRASGEADLFRKEIKAADIVVDIGANVGFFTLLAATNHVPVIAIEPSVANVEILLRNLQRASSILDVSVEVYPVALGAEPGVQTIHGTGQGASLLKGWGGVGSTHHRLTPVTTIDQLLADRLSHARRTAVIKLDVEGYEFEVSQGGARILSLEPSPLWIVEHCFARNFPACVTRISWRLFDLFWDAGYAAYTIMGRPVAKNDVEEWMQSDAEPADVNFVFRR